MLYDKDTRPNLANLSDDAIVVSTSVLHTGANPPPIKLVLFYGHVHDVDALLQGAGRSSRSTEEQGNAVLISTPFAIEEAVKIGKNAQGLLDVKALVEQALLPGATFQQCFNGMV